jgi:hypothetical protein
MAISTLRFSLVLLLVCLLQTTNAQFHGGVDDGQTVVLASSQPLGRNIFLGGVDDGTNVFAITAQPLGRNIFLGGIDDGTNVSAIAAQPLGRNIFLGGIDDGTNVAIITAQPLGRNIFLGGNDDGTNVSISPSQALGRNIFTGGADDGWAMAAAANVQLPITLSAFTGNWQQNDALLNWQTATESNSSHFELERSFDGSNFTTIGSINAAGQSNAVRNYSYTDVRVKYLLPQASPVVYYRLKAVDKDGTFVYSGIVILKADSVSQVEYAVFPNPAKDYINITANGSLPANAYIRLADVTGKVLLLQKMASNRQQLSVSNYASGTYFLQIIGENSVIYTQKVIIHQ